MKHSKNNIGFTLIRTLRSKNLERVQGFTLIELLIVIAIIALLAAISIFALAEARKTGRDAKRKADLETIRSALEFYKSDCGFYPEDTTLGALSTGCLPANNEYLEEIPEDDSTGREYLYIPIPGTDPTKYVLCAALEGVEGVAPGCSASCGTETCTYATKSP